LFGKRADAAGRGADGRPLAPKDAVEIRTHPRGVEHDGFPVEQHRVRQSGERFAQLRVDVRLVAAATGKQPHRAAAGDGEQAVRRPI